MDTEKLFKPGGKFKIIVVYLLFMVVFIAAVIIGNSIQTDDGKVSVSNVYFKNYNGKQLRAKLFRPIDANHGIAAIKNKIFKKCPTSNHPGL